MLQWKKLRRRPTNSTSRAPRCCHPHREVVSAPAPRLNSRRPSPTGSSIGLPTPGTRPLFDSDLKLHIGRTLDKESFRCPVSSLARSSSRSRPGPGSQRRAWTSTSDIGHHRLIRRGPIHPFRHPAHHPSACMLARCAVQPARANSLTHHCRGSPSVVVIAPHRRRVLRRHTLRPPETETRHKATALSRPLFDNTTPHDPRPRTHPRLSDNTPRPSTLPPINLDDDAPPLCPSARPRAPSSPPLRPR